LYLQLKNSLQPEDSRDFGKEIVAYERSIEPGMKAIQESDAKRPFNASAFETIVSFTKRYQNLAQAKYVLAFPDPSIKVVSERWQHIGEALLGMLRNGKVSYPIHEIAQMVSDYQNGHVSGFNQAVHDYLKYLKQTIPNELRRPSIEVLYNQSNLFVNVMMLYVLVFLFSTGSWLLWPKALGKTATILLVIAFVLHTVGLITRMYLQGRPPVTNLYSSAIYVGWGAALLCLVLERFYRNGIGSVCASVIGFVTLVIAYNLQLDGDTMEMLRAVLDTNVWLATHVVAVTTGYSSVCLAGVIGIIYILRGVATKSFDEQTSKTIARMIYGVVCFATLFSFVGTILGGIWADQSWGRFWGWDPKENGAVLIVLWNAIILHAKWGGFIRERGLAVMAVFGNIVFAWSWFGTNMLGVGLHSYGFTDQAFGGLMAFIVSQLVIMGIGLLPRQYWRGFR
jgi:ABC-type transport system involved in cytochrome c biogenesis permease subunit